MKRTRLQLVWAFVAASPIACGPDQPPPLPSDSFAFGVFGDGPYYFWERGRHRRLLADVASADVEWLIHVGDILWVPCSDEALRAHRSALDGIDLPVVYTPGDNEWTDCHERASGGFDPLDRQEALRRIFFDEPGQSLGGRPMLLETQAADPGFAGFPENARWSRGGFVFATLHMVGSWNGLLDFEGRTDAHDAEVETRTGAAIDWLEKTFDHAHAASARGIVLAVHGNVRLERRGVGSAYETFVAVLERRVAGFDGPVLFIHGDTHEQKVDQPLRNESGRVYRNFTRLETFGSPDIGWVRVVVDSVAGSFTDFEPRLMRGWY